MNNTVSGRLSGPGRGSAAGPEGLHIINTLSSGCQPDGIDNNVSYLNQSYRNLHHVTFELQPRPCEDPLNFIRPPPGAAEFTHT